MSDIDVEAIRNQLQSLQADFDRQIAELDSASETAVEFDENFADSGQVAAEQGENQSLVIGFREQLSDIEAALAKLDNGTYGLCEVCQKPIGVARLEALPSTRFCIEHA